MLMGLPPTGTPNTGGVTAVRLGPRNLAAKAGRTRQCRQQIIKPRKGVCTRRPKHTPGDLSTLYMIAAPVCGSSRA